MDYINDIYARLQKGETVETIAADLTKSINEAQAKFQAEASKREEEAKVKATRIESLKNFVGAIVDVLGCWGINDSVIVDSLEKISDQDYEEMLSEMDALVPLLEKYPDLMALHTPPISKPKTSVAAAADPLEEFLDQFIRNK